MRRITLLAAALALTLVGAFPPASASVGGDGAFTSVIVRHAPGSAADAERAVESLGGDVELRLPIINGFEAKIPAPAIRPLAALPGVVSVTPNAALQLQDDDEDDDRDKNDRDDRVGAVESIWDIAEIVGADVYWERGLTGRGVDVAIIDSGVTPVKGLNSGGRKLIHGPDLSFESQFESLRHLDTYGHGTFMAGLIGGRDKDVPLDPDRARGYAGIAPGSRIISVKVADAHGATDVSQVIAAIDWVVQHRRDNGMNIRVLNLSFGTYGAQPYALDPLAFAAEVAWHAGIFVVVSAGNDELAKGLMNPASDPYVLAVGGTAHNGTVATSDDTVMPASARGDGVRNPDVVAPGRSIIGLRVPGSYVDERFPAGRISDRLFRGSGTSQAAAITSGAAALIIEQRPRITPDQLKALLVGSATRLNGFGPRAQGAGIVDLAKAFDRRTPKSAQTWVRSTGTGSLELSRGRHHLVSGGVRLEGERDIFGAPFNSAAHAAVSAAGRAWTGGSWNGSVWTGPGWSGSEWSTAQWTSASWSGSEWSASEWSASEWSASEWSGSEWSGSEWSASEWSASEWSASEWSGSEWSTDVWQTAEWSSAR
jgi:serine protease AprX